MDRKFYNTNTSMLNLYAKCLYQKVQNVDTDKDYVRWVHGKLPMMADGVICEDMYGIQKFFNVSETAISEPSRNITYGDGFSYLVSGTSPGYALGPSGSDNLLHLVSFFGCESTGRHKGQGANYGFADGHCKYFPLNVQAVESQNANGDWISKYFSYDQ